MSRTTPGACIGCGRPATPPRRAWPAHPAHGEPCCPGCRAFEAGEPGTLQELVEQYDAPDGPPPLSDYERTELARGYMAHDIYDTRTGQTRHLEPIDLLERDEL